LCAERRSGGDRQARHRRRLSRRADRIRHQGEELAYRTFDKIRRVNQAAVVENKRLGSLLEMIKAYQDSQPPPARSSKAPKRRDQTGHRFSRH
jgi:hypothetical protein